METDVLIKLVRRTRVLETLREEGAMDRRDFEQALAVSKPTVHRFTRFLGEQGLLVRENGLFRLTLAGEIVAEELVRLCDTVEWIDELQQVIRWLPVEAFDFDPRHLHDAEIVLPDCNDPFAPIHEMSARFDAAGRIRVLSSVYLSETFAALDRGVVETDTSVTCVYDSRVIDVIRADEQATRTLERLLASGAVVTVSSTEIPFVLSIADETVLICAVDDSGTPQALVVSEDSVVTAWAEAVCERYLRETEPVAVDGAADAGSMVPAQSR